MKDTAKKIMVRIGILGGMCILAGVLALLQLTAQEDHPITSSLVNSETVYIMLALSFVVPLALLVLTVSVALTSMPVIKGGKLRWRKKRRGGAQQPRFANLSRIDTEQRKQTVSVYDHRSLPQICEEFRDFAAGKLGLYYDIADIRRFVAGLGMSRLMISNIIPR